MAAKASKTKTGAQVPKAAQIPALVEGKEPAAGQKEPMEEQEKGMGQGEGAVAGPGGVQSDVPKVVQKPKILQATRPVLYLARQYMAGDALPVNDPEMVSAWLEAGSAAWQEPGGKGFP